MWVALTAARCSYCDIFHSKFYNQKSHVCHIKREYSNKRCSHLFCSVQNKGLYWRITSIITREKNKFNTIFVLLFGVHMIQNLSLYQDREFYKRQMLHSDICSSIISTPLPSLTFELIIDDGRCLKYSHRDLVHQHVDNRPHIGST